MTNSGAGAIPPSFKGPTQADPSEEDDDLSKSRIYGYLWAKYSKQRLQAHPLCVYCMRRKRRTPATVTDHIKPHKQDQVLFWDPKNHQSLCASCHGREKQREEIGYVERWNGGTILCVASGPSLTVEDVEFARSRVHAAFVTNSTYKRVPWAHVLYAADFTWWKSNIHNVRASGFSGELWTVSVDAARQHRINYIRGETQKEGLSRDPACIRTGTHSGYQIMNLAYHMGARRILLLGYDMQRTDGKSHWHGDHVSPCHNSQDFKLALSRFPRLAVDLKSEGIEVVNCTRATALKSFPRATIQEVFA